MPFPAWLALAGLAFTTLLQTATFAFFMGRLFQKVEALERAATGDASLNDKVIRLEVQMENANANLASMDRHLQGVNRQLANIATGQLLRQPGEV